MKTLLTIFAASLTLATGYNALAQGAVIFANVGQSVNAPIFSVVHPTGPAAGTDFTAQLWWAPLGSNELQLQPVGDTTFFLTGPMAGYFNAGPRTITGAAGGTTVMLQVRAWTTISGTTWEQAVVSTVGGVGKSYLFNATLTAYPATPPYLVALQSFNIGIIPEPSTSTLCLWAAGAFLLFRRSRFCCFS